MKRNMDLIRDLLLQIEDGRRSFDLLTPEIAEVLGESSEGKLPREQAELLEYHLDLLDNAGLITIKAKLSGAAWQIGQITWAGHDFLDTIRDPSIWRETKAGAKKAGGFSLDLLKALAKGLVKKKIEQHPGVESNRKNNLLISILFLEQTQAFPHTLPHIFVHLTVVLFSVLTGKLNKWVVRAAPDRNIMVRSDAVQLRVSGLVSSMPDAAPPTYANWLS